MWAWGFIRLQWEDRFFDIFQRKQGLPNDEACSGERDLPDHEENQDSVFCFSEYTYLKKKISLLLFWKDPQKVNH